MAMAYYSDNRVGDGAKAEQGIWNRIKGTFGIQFMKAIRGLPFIGDDKNGKIKFLNLMGIAEKIARITLGIPHFRVNLADDSGNPLDSETKSTIRVILSVIGTKVDELLKVLFNEKGNHGKIEEWRYDREEGRRVKILREPYFHEIVRGDIIGLFMGLKEVQGLQVWTDASVNEIPDPYIDLCNTDLGRTLSTSEVGKKLLGQIAAQYLRETSSVTFFSWMQYRIQDAWVTGTKDLEQRRGVPYSRDELFEAVERFVGSKFGYENWGWRNSSSTMIPLAARMAFGQDIDHMMREVMAKLIALVPIAWKTAKGREALEILKNPEFNGPVAIRFMKWVGSELVPARNWKLGNRGLNRGLFCSYSFLSYVGVEEGKKFQKGSSNSLLDGASVDVVHIYTDPRQDRSASNPGFRPWTMELSELDEPVFIKVPENASPGEIERIRRRNEMIGRHSAPGKLEIRYAPEYFSMTGLLPKESAEESAEESEEEGEVSEPSETQVAEVEDSELDRFFGMDVSSASPKPEAHGSNGGNYAMARAMSEGLARFKTGNGGRKAPRS